MSSPSITAKPEARIVETSACEECATYCGAVFVSSIGITQTLGVIVGIIVLIYGAIKKYSAKDELEADKAQGIKIIGALCLVSAFPIIGAVLALKILDQSETVKNNKYLSNY